MQRHPAASQANNPMSWWTVVMISWWQKGHVIWTGCLPKRVPSGAPATICTAVYIHVYKCVYNAPCRPALDKILSNVFRVQSPKSRPICLTLGTELKLIKNQYSRKPKNIVQNLNGRVLLVCFTLLYTTADEVLEIESMTMSASVE